MGGCKALISGIVGVIGILLDTRNIMGMFLPFAILRTSD